MRQLSYTACFLVFAAILTLIANKNRFIHLNKYLPGELVPQYFQPPSDAYVVDLLVGGCNFVNLNAPDCGKPEEKAGYLGDVLKEGGEWVKVQKDLLLGLLWVSKRFLYQKKVKPDYFDSHNGLTIHQIWVGTKEDCKIRGNKECIPKEVLKDFANNHPFDDDDHKFLLEANKDEKLRVSTDKSKAADTYIADFVKEKEKQQEQAESEEGKAKEEEEHAKEELGEMINPTNKLDGDGLPEEKSSESSEKKPEEERKQAEQAEEKKVEEVEKAESNDKEHKQRLVRRTRETNRHNLKNYMVIPTKEQLAKVNWKKLGNDIWVKYGAPGSKSVTGIDVLFGPDAVDPRPNWNLLPHPILNTGAPPHLAPRLSFRVGPRVDYKASSYQQKLKFSRDGKYKVLQVADLHFSTGVGKCRDPVPAESEKGCEADPRTLKFINKVLDLEKPDFVVMTGDQVFGQAAPDPETALFKAVLPFIERKIPFAITLGNHDDESNLSREQMMLLALSLPFSVAAIGPEAVDGYGNYVVTVESGKLKQLAAAFYFLDSHSYSKQPKTNPGYDWFKDSQINWVGMEAESIFGQSHKTKDELLSMAFFHIPIPQYRDVQDKPMVGQLREGITAPRYHTDMRSAFSLAGILVASVGHDHANDYCLLNTDDKDLKYQHDMWLCYGGGAGEGGYGGYGGYIRRVRVYELDSASMDVKTWKRAENDPDQVFDEQKVVENGKAMNHV